VRKAYIGIHGCDGSTIFTKRITEIEYYFLKEIEKESKENSGNQCEPTLVVSWEKQ